MAKNRTKPPWQKRKEQRNFSRALRKAAWIYHQREATLEHCPDCGSAMLKGRQLERVMLICTRCGMHREVTQ